MFVYQRKYCLFWKPTFLKVNEHLLAIRRQRINSLFCFACDVAFAFRRKVYLKLQVLALFQFSPPSHLGRLSEWLDGAELPAGVRTFPSIYIYRISGEELKFLEVDRIRKVLH